MDQWLSATPSTPPRLVVEELRSLGHAEPRVRYEWRHPAGSADALERYATELVSLRPEVLLAFGSISSRALYKATSTIPIVAWITDPTKIGLATPSLLPRRNVTGFVDQGGERIAKALELLRSMLPGMDKLGVLEPPDAPFSSEVVAALRAFAPALKMGVVTATFRSRREMERGMAYLEENKVVAAVAWPSPGMMRLSEAVALALRHRIALVGEGVGARYGQLLTFSPEIPARQMAQQVDKILRGVPLMQIPFELPQRFIVHVNRRTAGFLGISIPPEVALRVNHFYDEWEESAH